MPKAAIEFITYILQRDADSVSSRASTWKNVHPTTIERIRYESYHRGFNTVVVDSYKETVKVII